MLDVKFVTEDGRRRTASSIILGYIQSSPELSPAQYYPPSNLSSKTTVLRSSVPPFLLRNCCTLLALPISPEIMDRF